MTAPLTDPLPLLLAPDPRLKAKTRTVTEQDRATVRSVVPRMLATMYAAPGIGLAATFASP
jgi:peptide deformylase